MRALTPRPAHGASGTEKDPRWAAVVARDRDADGTFYYSVKTTGVYCRPVLRRAPARTPRTCGSIRRPPTRSARASGPASAASRTEPPLERRHAATRSPGLCRVDRDRGGDAEPGGARQARRAQPSSLPSRLQGRHRPDAAGVRGGASRRARPRRAAAAADGDRGHLRRRLQLRRPLLRDVRRDAGHDADATTAPAAPHTDIRFAVGECSLGSILVAQSAKGVCAILLGDDPDALVRDLQDRFPRATLIGGDAALRAPRGQGRRLRRGAGARPRSAARRARHRVPAARVAGAARRSRPARPPATPRSRERIGAPKAVRAVAQACAANAARGRDSLPSRRAAATAPSRAIAGASSASARCSSARRSRMSTRERRPRASPSASSEPDRADRLGAGRRRISTLTAAAIGRGPADRRRVRGAGRRSTTTTSCSAAAS